MNRKISEFDPIRTAALLFNVTGILGVALFTPTAVLTALGIDTSKPLGVTPEELGFIQGIGGTVYLVSVSLFAVLSIVEIMAGRWLREGHRKGGVVGVINMVPSFLLSLGMSLPIWLFLHPIKFLLLLVGWKQVKK